MPETFRFEDPRVIEAAWPDYLDEPWLELAGLSDDDRVQLEAILRQYDPDLTEERFQRATARQLFVGSLAGFEEEPVEIWDLVDDASYVRYTLWLFFARQGVLFEAGGTTMVGEIVHGSFHANGEVLDMSEERELARQIHRAQQEARKKHPESELASVAFVRQTRF